MTKKKQIYTHEATMVPCNSLKDESWREKRLLRLTPTERWWVDKYWNKYFGPHHRHPGLSLSYFTNHKIDTKTIRKLKEPVKR